MILWLVVGTAFLILWLTLCLPDLNRELKSTKPGAISVSDHVFGHLFILLLAAIIGGLYVAGLSIWSSNNGNAYTTAREWGYSLTSDVRLVSEDPKNDVSMDVIWTDPKGIQHTGDAGYINIVQVPKNEPARYVKRTLVPWHPMLLPWSKTGPEQPMDTLYVHAGQVVAK